MSMSLDFNDISDEERTRFVIEPLHFNDVQRAKLIEDVLKPLIFTPSIIQRIQETFRQEMELALRDKPSSLQMENTYIPELPDGTEHGVYLALDLGGTNFRVILMELASNGKIVREKVHNFHIDDEIRIGCGEKLFDYLAESVNIFVLENNLQDLPHIPLGFTFSFPMRQHSLDSGVLITWTKSFNCPSAVNKDAVQLLRNSLHTLGRDNVEILAILNDTTGTLIQGAKLDPATRIGIVLGTGNNGAYMEKAERVRHWEQKRHGEHHVIIDIEWGAFGDNGVLDFIKTDFDKAVDTGSLLKTSFTFEKYLSGKYLGELARNILLALMKKRAFMPKLNGNDNHFPQEWKFNSENISRIEQDSVDGTLNRTHEVFEKFGYSYNKHYDDDDIAIIRHVCGTISQRAAYLIAINAAILLKRMDENEITIAIDGSVYKHHPRLRYWLQKFTAELAPTKKSKYMLAEDGSGKGAALAAAIAQRIRARLCNEK